MCICVYGVSPHSNNFPCVFRVPKQILTTPLGKFLLPKQSNKTQKTLTPTYRNSCSNTVQYNIPKSACTKYPSLPHIIPARIPIPVVEAPINHSRHTSLPQTLLIRLRHHLPFSLPTNNLHVRTAPFDPPITTQSRKLHAASSPLTHSAFHTETNPLLNCPQPDLILLLPIFCAFTLP